MSHFGKTLGMYEHADGAAVTMFTWPSVCGRCQWRFGRLRISNTGEYSYNA